MFKDAGRVARQCGMESFEKRNDDLEYGCESFEAVRKRVLEMAVSDFH